MVRRPARLQPWSGARRRSIPWPWRTRPPTFYLEEFGDNALILLLDFWVDISVEPNWRRVMSDLRHRLGELFGEHCIAIAFPQRNVHLDSVKPMKVELIAARPRVIEPEKEVFE